MKSLTLILLHPSILRPFDFIPKRRTIVLETLFLLSLHPLCASCELPESDLSSSSFVSPSMKSSTSGGRSPASSVLSFTNSFTICANLSTRGSLVYLITSTGSSKDSTCSHFANHSCSTVVQSL